MVKGSKYLSRYQKGAADDDDDKAENGSDHSKARAGTVRDGGWETVSNIFIERLLGFATGLLILGGLVWLFADRRMENNCSSGAVPVLYHPTNSPTQQGGKSTPTDSPVYQRRRSSAK
jgi:hypothetical protein